MSYYIVYYSDSEFLFDYDLANKHVETTGMEIEARQFNSRMQAEFVAERIGGLVKEIQINQ